MLPTLKYDFPASIAVFFVAVPLCLGIALASANAKVIIDCTNSKSIAYDVVELINNFKSHAKVKNIVVETINFLNPSDI